MSGKKPGRTTDAAAAGESPPAGERIAKRLARAGIASRRDAERLIQGRRVKVDGAVIESPALNVTDDQVIHVDGVQVGGAQAVRLWLYHKPPGLMTTRARPEGPADDLRQSAGRHAPIPSASGGWT